MTCPATTALARLITDLLVIVDDEALTEELRVHGDRYITQLRDDLTTLRDGNPDLGADLDFDGFNIEQTLASFDAALDHYYEGGSG